MGNSISHKKTKAPKQASKERPPDMDKSQGKQFPSHFKQKPNAKIVLLFPLNKRQQRTAAAAGPGSRPQRPNEDASGARAGLASPMLLGAGDNQDRRQHPRRCGLTVQILLPQRQEEGRRREEGARAGGGAEAQRAGPKAARVLLRLSRSEAGAGLNLGQRRRRCTLLGP